MTELPPVDKERDFWRLFWDDAQITIWGMTGGCLFAFLLSYLGNVYINVNPLASESQKWQDCWNYFKYLFIGVLILSLVMTISNFKNNREIWQGKWRSIEEPTRRKYAYLYRIGRALYLSPPQNERERNDRSDFLNNELEKLKADEEQFKRWLKHSGDSAQKQQRYPVRSVEFAHVMAEFADAKALIGLEAQKNSQKKSRTSVRLDFLNIEGAAFIGYEGDAVKRITAKIAIPGEYVLKQMDGSREETLETISDGEVSREFSMPLESGELRIQSLDEKVVERIPLP